MLIAEVARSQNVSSGFLAKIFQNLSRVGLVESHRGAGGGVSLGMSPDKINVRMILEAIEGQIALNNCLLEHGGCTDADHCALAGMWRRAQDAMMDVLETTSLAELAAAERER